MLTVFHGSDAKLLTTLTYDLSSYAGQSNVYVQIQAFVNTIQTMALEFTEISFGLIISILLL